MLQITGTHTETAFKYIHIYIFLPELASILCIALLNSREVACFYCFARVWEFLKQQFCLCSPISKGMPRELTQNRIQKIWIPSKDDKPSMPRKCKCVRAEFKLILTFLYRLFY